VDILNVLVVDDEYGMRRGAERALRDIVLHLPDINGEVGFEIRTAATGKELEEKLVSGPTDILLIINCRTLRDSKYWTASARVRSTS
jgi:two-component system, sensor histidine kinase and response regulator